MLISWKHESTEVNQRVPSGSFVSLILSVKALEDFSLGKCDMEQTAAPEVIDEVSLPFPSAEVNRQPDVLMLTKPHWQMHTHAVQC